MNFVEIAIPFFILAMAVELAYGAWKRNQTYRLNDAVASLMMGSLSQLVGVLRLSFAAVVFAGAVELMGVVAWAPEHWWHWVAAFVAYDLCYYWKHRFGHEWRIMWASHSAHHQSEEYNLSTALRQTSTDYIGFVFYLPMYLAIDNFEILNEKLFDDYNRDKVVLICTGSQGEKNSALSKIANNTHNQIKLSPKDNIIFSSKEIPGNEKSISYLKNSFSFIGLNIITDVDEFVHVSGHPGIPEIKEFYQFLKPLSLIPMHGEYLHLKKHLEIANDLKIEKTSLLLSGDICQIDLINKNHKIIEQLIIKKLPVIQNSIIEEMDFLNERGKILNNGIVSMNIILSKKFEIIKLQTYNKGFPFPFNKEIIEDEIKEILLNKILFIKEEINENILRDLLKEISKKTFSRNFSLKPEFFVHISLI